MIPDRDAIPGGVMPRGAITGDTITGDMIAGDTIPGDTIPGDAIPSDTIPGDAIPRDAMPRGAMPRGAIPRFPVYLFDIDGTLLDSAEDICGAIQQVLSATDCSPVTFDYLKSFIGRHLIDLFSDVFPGCTQQRMDGLIQQYRTTYLARRHQQTRVYPGVDEALAALGGRKGTATTKGTPTTRAILDQFGLLPYFEHVQGTDGFPCKPAPDVILASLAALGARPDQCLFVGDSAADMEAGKRAGVKTCAVRYGYGKPEDLARFEPDFWVDDLREVAG